MKEKLLQYKKYLLFVAIIGAVFVGYTMFFKSEPTPDLVKEEANSVASTDNRELLNQLQSLNAISLNSEIFSSPLFNILQDNTVIIENRKPEGRKNPFMPIGFDNGSFTPNSDFLNATTNTNGLLNNQGSSSSTSAIPTPSNLSSTQTPKVVNATTSKATSSPKLNTQ